MVFIVGAEKLQFDSEGNPYFLRTIDKLGNTEKIQPENSLVPCLKEISTQIVLKREGYTPDMRRKVWYGLQQIKISIPKDDKHLRYYYLVFLPKCMQSVCVKILSPQMISEQGSYLQTTWSLSLNPSKDSVENGWIEFIGEPKTITALKVAELLQNKEILAIVTDDGELAQ